MLLMLVSQNFSLLYINVLILVAADFSSYYFHLQQSHLSYLPRAIRCVCVLMMASFLHLQIRRLLSALCDPSQSGPTLEANSLGYLNGNSALGGCYDG